MQLYLFQRTLRAVLVLLAIATLVFLLMRVLPGDPTQVLMAQGGGGFPDSTRLRAEYGLDRPLSVQYATFLFDLFRGRLGTSIFTGQSVRQIVAQQAPETIVLACTAMAVALLLGLPLGTIASMRQGTWIDKLCMATSIASVSVPIALSGLLMILLFSLKLPLLPASGQGTPLHIIMPAMAMGIASAGSIARVARAELVETLNKDYVNVARAKGLSEWTLLTRHAARNVLIPVITLVGLQFGFMLGGAVVTESIFARQGLGRTLVDAILYQDYPIVQGVIIVTASLYTAVNLVVDLVHCYLDPRFCRR
jgi:ABC-type dipeptide/oligopeptide/nickel transport system permease component